MDNVKNNFDGWLSSISPDERPRLRHGWPERQARAWSNRVNSYTVGKWLRELSFDKLSQFINVLRSDMSVVGPRPALPNEVATHNDYQRQRLLVKPGMTCYWQTRRNRDSITFDEWVDLDFFYIKKCSVLSDLKSIVQTVGVVLTAQGS